jgi:hypothetical protein
MRAVGLSVGGMVWVFLRRSWRRPPVKKWLSIVAVLAALPCDATAVYWTGATTDTTVTVLETDVADDCVLFTLAGVPEANPVNPGQP